VSSRADASRRSVGLRITAGVCGAFLFYALARALVASAWPWQRAFDDFFFLPETLRWIAGGALGSDATFARVPLWHLLLGAHLRVFGHAGLLVLQAWIVLATCIGYGLRVGACAGWISWIPLWIFLASPQILLYSRQGVNELFVGLLTLGVLGLGEWRGARAALAMGVLVGLATCTKLSACLLGLVACGYALREGRGAGQAFARLALGFALVSVPLLGFAAAQRGSWLIDNTTAFNLSGMTLDEWRALPDAATRQAAGMERWWQAFSGAPAGYLLGASRRALDWLVTPSSADFELFYPEYPLAWIRVADTAAFAALTSLALLGTSRRNAFAWLVYAGWTAACAFPQFTPRSPKVILLFAALLPAAHGIARISGRIRSLSVAEDPA
jgi:hypothetical protein